jgi:hypothetical protein
MGDVTYLDAKRAERDVLQFLPRLSPLLREPGFERKPPLRARAESLRFSDDLVVWCSLAELPLKGAS